MTSTASADAPDGPVDLGVAGLDIEAEHAQFGQEPDIDAQHAQIVEWTVPTQD